MISIVRYVHEGEELMLSEKHKTLNFNNNFKSSVQNLLKNDRDVRKIFADIN